MLWASHVLGTLLLWPAVAVTALLVLDLLLVRRMVRVQRRAATRARSGARPASATRPARRTASVRVPAQGRTTTTADGTPPIESVTSVAARAVAEVDPAAPRPVHSQEAVTEVIMLEGMWQPVRVPPPTYTMKAKADRVPVYSSSSAPMESDSSPERPVEAPTPPALVAVVDDELDAVLDRRRAAGE